SPITSPHEARVPVKALRGQFREGKVMNVLFGEHPIPLRTRISCRTHRFCAGLFSMLLASARMPGLSTIVAFLAICMARIPAHAQTYIATELDLFGPDGYSNYSWGISGFGQLVVIGGSSPLFVPGLWTPTAQNGSVGSFTALPFLSSGSYNWAR